MVFIHSKKESCNRIYNIEKLLNIKLCFMLQRAYIVRNCAN